MRTACASALLAATFAAGPAPAQESDFFDQLSTYFKSETIEGVSKHAEAPTETPATVTIVTREQIERYGFRTVSDVLNFASVGSVVTRDRRYDLASSRGLAFLEDFNTRILVMLNGHPLNEPWSNFADLGRAMLVPLDLVERIEIVYGPSALLYGGYSLYGIVNVITASGATSPGWRVRATRGSWDTRELVASWGATGTTGSWEAPGTEWSFFGAAGYYATDGEDLELPRFDAGYAVALDGSTLWGGPQQGTDFEKAPFAFLHARYGELSLMLRSGFRERGAPLAPYGAIYGRDDQTLRDAKSFGELRWDRSFGSGLTLSLRGFHDVYTYDEQDPYADAASYPGEPGYSFRLATRDEDTGGELRVNLRRGTHFVTFGGELRHRTLGQISSSRFFDGRLALGSAIRQETTGRLAVLYFQEEWRPLDQLSLVAGGNWADTRPGGSKAQPRLALIYKPDASLSVKALYGRGFRPPSVFEARYQDFLTQVGNPALESEEIESVEASMIWNASPRLALQAYGFRSRLSGLIQGVTIVDPADVQGSVVPPSGDPADLVGQLQYQSAGDVVSSGAGGQLRYRGRRLQGHLNLAWSRAEKEVAVGPAQPLPGSSRWLGSAGVSWAERDWSLGLVARYAGPQPLDPSRGGGEAEGFVEANLRLLYDTRIVYPVRFSLDVRNLLDRRDGPAASPVFALPVLPLEGRRVLLGAEVRF